MDTVRRILGVLLIVGLPPAVLYWLIVHPFVGFWRRVGPRVTYSVVAILFAGMCLALFTGRGYLLGRDLGTRWGLIGMGVVWYLASAWVSLLARKQLDLRTFAGLPEVSPAHPGRLLTEGVYGVIRHPRYVSVVLGVTGLALAVNFLGVYLVVLGSMLALIPVTVLEGRELARRFGKEYQAYRRRVPAWIPRVRR